jgi:hypothetical protein
MIVFARGENFAQGTDFRLAFETERDGKVDRRFAKAPIRIAAAPGAGAAWGKPVAIMVNDLPLQSAGQMKIIFELTGPGEVWIDNVKLSDLLFSLSFYTNSQLEILQLVQQTHKLQGALEQGQLSECLMQMDGYWPRFIRAYTPPPPPKVAMGPAAKPAAPAANGQQQDPSGPPANKGDQPAPGVGDRLKRMVPFYR